MVTSNPRTKDPRWRVKDEKWKGPDLNANVGPSVDAPRPFPACTERPRRSPSRGGTGRGLALWLLAAVTVGALGCILDASGKDRCRSTTDCLDGNTCVDDRCVVTDVPEWCNNTCSTASDSVCDDGGEGSDYDTCDFGSDCADCGTRGGDGDGDGDGDAADPCGVACSEMGFACNEDRCMAVAEQENDLFICDATAPRCPGEQSCILGTCAKRCEGFSDCPIGLQCDEGGTDRCVLDTVIECNDIGDCESTQTCVQGICTGTTTLTPCTPGIPDECGPRALCLDGLDDEGATGCVEVPACSQFDSCPDGTSGAVCHTDDAADGKDRICLIGRCLGGSDCPVEDVWECLQVGTSNSLGWCSDFSMGAYCIAERAGDCPGGTCAIINGNDVGRCE